MSLLKNTIKRKDIILKISNTYGIAHNHAAELLDFLLQHLQEAIIEEGFLKISSFGNFEILYKKARIGRNPKVGSKHLIKPRAVISFKGSRTLKKRIQNKA